MNTEIKKSAYEWSKDRNLIIYDPDGWRPSSPYGEKSLDELITEKEFDYRIIMSTVLSNCK